MRVFVSEGFVYLADMPMGIQSGTVLLFPFLPVEITNWHGLQSNTISPWIKCYKATLYSSLPNAILNQIPDINNREQVELYIRKVLEIYLLSYSIFYKEAVQFQFHNTRPFSGTIPSGVTPLDIDVEDGQYRRLFVDQTLIRTGGRVSNTQLGNTPLAPGHDLSAQRFSLVKPSGSGGMMRGMPDDLSQIIAGHIILDEYAQRLRRKRNDRILVKAMDFLRRALVLERSGFYNEAYLNYFKIIEAFAGVYGGRQINAFLRGRFGMNVNQAKRLIKARNTVTAHGSASLTYLREVGQKELYTLQECAFKLIEEKLDR